jgi:hypothetical protein
LHMNEEIGMIENGIHEEIWTIFDVIDFASWRFNKHILSNTSLSLFEQDPAVYSFA